MPKFHQEDCRPKPVKMFGPPDFRRRMIDLSMITLSYFAIMAMNSTQGLELLEAI